MKIDLTALAFISSFIDKKFSLSKNKSLNVFFGYDTTKANGSPTCNISFEEIVNAIKSDLPIQFQCIEYNEDLHQRRYIIPHSVQVDTNEWSEIIVHVFEGGSPTFTYTSEGLSVSLIEINKL